MTFSALQEYLNTTSVLRLFLPDGSPVPPHFHLTEVGRSTKKFVDCGGQSRSEIGLRSNFGSVMKTPTTA
ncbi:MAG: hypothetical protein HC821_05015 [Lewinella sp.]|nr:hypothetical protein [Lewinella sp.]